MHIFVVMASGARGGGANHLLALLPALAALGIRSTAWVGDDGPLAAMLQNLCIPGIEAYARPLMGRRGDYLMARQIHAAASASGANLIHAHGTRAGVLCAMAAVSRSPGAPRVYSAHGLAHRAGGNFVSRSLRLSAEWLCCAGAAALISVSASDLDVLRQLPGQQQIRRFHVPNVVTFSPPPEVVCAGVWPAPLRAAARARFGLPVDKPLVGTVARLVPQKNVVALADGVLPLKDVHLAVLGEGSEKQQLERHPLARQGRLHLLGARDDVPEFLPALDVFALTSRWEGEPIALLEAMAYAVPWVATRTLGVAEIQRATNTGTLVPQRNQAALTHALQQLLEDEAFCLRESQAGMRAMLQRTPQALAARMAQIYQQVLS